MNEILIEINRYSEQIDLGATTISEYAGNLSQSSSEQASSIESLSNTISLMASQIQETAKNASNANNASENSKKSIDQSMEDMSKLLTSEQAQTASLVSDEIQRMSVIIKDNSGITESSANTAYDLHDQSKKLRGLLEEFNLS